MVSSINIYFYTAKAFTIKSLEGNIIRYRVHNLPFGGVNNSGMGKPHGFFGFHAFSNEKPVLKQKNGFASVKAFYPPYTRRSNQLMDWFLKFF